MPSPKRQPVIEFWSPSDAPQHVQNALPKGSTYDWVAIVPKELQDDTVLTLLTQGPGVHGGVYLNYLPDGVCLVAGASAPETVAMLAACASASYGREKPAVPFTSAHKAGAK